MTTPTPGADEDATAPTSSSPPPRAAEPGGPARSLPPIPGGDESESMVGPGSGSGAPYPAPFAPGAPTVSAYAAPPTPFAAHPAVPLAPMVPTVPVLRGGYVSPMLVPVTAHPRRGARRTWALVSLILGALLILAAVIGLAELRILDAIQGTLFAAATGGPGAWWLYCEKTDGERLRTGAADWDADRRATAVLGDAAAPPPPIRLIDRRWMLVGPGAVLLLLLGGMVGG